MVNRKMKKKAGKKTKMPKKLTYRTAKSTSVMSVQNSLRWRPYTFVRIGRDNILESNYLQWQSGAMPFSLSSVVDNTEFTNLFESYQIVKVQVDFVPDIQQVNQQIGDGTANALTIPTLYVSRDLDNTVAPTNEDVLRSRTDVIRRSATKPLSISLVPQVGREIYRSAVTTAYETPFQLTWLDTVYEDVPHYGLTYGITPTGASNNNVKFSYKIETKYWLRFRGAR